MAFEAQNDSSPFVSPKLSCAPSQIFACLVLPLPLAGFPSFHLQPDALLDRDS